jgi:hypothetical protein
MKKQFTILALFSAVVLLATSCKKDKNDDVPVYDIPTTYNFSNANFADATTRLGMLTEIGNITKAATAGPIDGVKLKAMLTNTGAPFATAAYNTSGIQLNDQFAPVFKTEILASIDSLVKVAATGKTASKGVAGVGASTANAATKYALTGLGVNYAQVINKGAMGGLVIYQIASTMDKIASLSIDNSTIVNGETAMEHAWDMSFGYWGVPIDFPTNKTGAKFYGSYSTQVDSGFKANKILMGAFLKGRAAVSHKDNKVITEQATLIIQTLETLNAAAVEQEVKEVKESLSDNIARNSRLSECWGFVNSMKYNPKRTITDAQIANFLTLFPANFYDLTKDQVDAIRDAVSKQYSFEAVKDIL